MTDVYTTLLAKLQKYCALEDRCQFQIRDRLSKQHDLENHEKEMLLASLINEGFVDDQRFAQSFARGKFRIKAWGRNKIRSELMSRHISEGTIDRALEEIEEKAYFQTIVRLLEKKQVETTDQTKLFRYLSRKGYESEFINQALAIVVGPNP